MLNNIIVKYLPTSMNVNDHRVVDYGSCALLVGVVMFEVDAVSIDFDEEWRVKRRGS